MMDRFSAAGRGACAASIAIVALSFGVCGGADGGTPSSAAAEQATPGKVQLASITLPAATAELTTEPQFHVAPVVLAAPEEVDAANPAASALVAPHRQAVRAELAQLSTRRLTQEAIDSVLRDGIVPSEFSVDNPGATPLSSGTVVATYTPAQIRAAYGLPSLPASGALTSSQAAQLGAGQTIYIIDAQDDPNAAVELATFNQTFGLPKCSTTSISPGAALPLQPAATTGCSFAVVYSNASGAMTAAAPAYTSSWATEIALDVQWAHATAPLARIILIEAPDTSVASMVAAVSLANAMGPGLVSMSFGSSEGSWTASLDAAFTHASMTYLAGAGDSGAGVNWPAVSTHVLAVGGSTLTYTGSTPRSEVVWSGTGGGVSQFTPTPVYQTSAVPGLGAPTRRSVSDVTFNADPTTGQYVAVLAPGATSVNWLSAGGTSLATPQWAGIIAVANAMRALGSQAALGDPHARLYALAAQGSSYASNFYDITRGSDGTCATCYAGIGYDQPSGIGTPNVGTLLSALDAAPAAPAPVTSSPAQAPTVASASIGGSAGVALVYAVSVTDANPVTYTLSGAPSGMTISSAGVLGWSTPLSGNYAVTVTAHDTKSGLSGHGVISISIAPPKAPVVTPANIPATAGKAMSFKVSVTAPDSVTFGLSGAPAGMTISSSGVLTWPHPVAGTFTLTVTAKDTKTGLTGSAVCKVIVTPAGPVITAAAMSGVAGKTLSGTISFADSTSSALTITISGAPAGMVFTQSGASLAVHWTSPVEGNYVLKVSAKDGNGLTASLNVPVAIAAP